MPSGRRRTGRRNPSLPVRTTSYRQPPTSQPDSPQAPPRASQRLVPRPMAVPQPSPVPLASTVTRDRLCVTLPVPPSINHQYATVNGRRLLSSTGRAYKLQVAQQVWLALSQSPHKEALLQRFRTEPLALSIRFFFTSPVRRDIDGGLKIAQDALCEGLGVNDNRIVEAHLYKDMDRQHPRIEVTLSPHPPAPL